MTKQVRNSKELVDIFDNEICYYMMTADTIYENLSDNLLKSNDAGGKSNSPVHMLSVIDEVQKFYIIETSYYLNRSVDKICLMNNNVINTLRKSGSNDYANKKISLTRFLNIINLMRYLYVSLDQLSKCFTSLDVQRRENEHYIICLNLLIDDVNSALALSGSNKIEKVNLV